jgi:hypothetical protein
MADGIQIPVTLCLYARVFIGSDITRTSPELLYISEVDYKFRILDEIL